MGRTPVRIVIEFDGSDRFPEVRIEAGSETLPYQFPEDMLTSGEYKVELDIDDRPFRTSLNEDLGDADRIKNPPTGVDGVTQRLQCNDGIHLTVEGTSYKVECLQGGYKVRVDDADASVWNA